MATHYSGTETERRALEVYIKLFRASNTVGERVKCSIDRCGLTMSQFGALETLYHLGPMMACRLAEKHLKSRNNFTTVIDNLERDGLVRRVPHAEDRRATLVELTPQGRLRIEAAIPGHVADVVDAFAILSAEEQQHLGDLLKKLGTQAKASES